MWLKVAIVAVILLYLMKRNADAAATPDAQKVPAGGGSVDIGEGVAVTFHQGDGVWSDIWKRPPGYQELGGCDFQTYVDGKCVQAPNEIIR